MALAEPLTRFLRPGGLRGRAARNSDHYSSKRFYFLLQHRHGFLVKLALVLIRARYDQRTARARVTEKVSPRALAR